MCEACGCTVTPTNLEISRRHNEAATTSVSVLRTLLHRNDAVAAHNRAHFGGRTQPIHSIV